MQIGMPPVNIYNELKIADKLALHSEIAMGIAYSYGATKNHFETSFGAAIEPLFYYNFNKRIQKG